MGSEATPSMRDEQGREPELGLKTERLRSERPGAGGGAAARRRDSRVSHRDGVWAGSECAGFCGGCEDFCGETAASWDPMIVHVEGRAMLERVAKLPAGNEGHVVAKLMEAFWPGPLTLLLPRTVRFLIL